MSYQSSWCTYVCMYVLQITELINIKVIQLSIKRFGKFSQPENYTITLGSVKEQCIL